MQCLNYQLIYVFVLKWEAFLQFLLAIHLRLLVTVIYESILVDFESCKLRSVL